MRKAMRSRPMRAIPWFEPSTERVLIVRFRAPLIHRSQSVVVEGLDADEYLPATGAMQQAGEGFLHVRAHETAPSDPGSLAQELFRKCLQPAGASIQK